jgi:hypothetical protein
MNNMNRKIKMIFLVILTTLVTISCDQNVGKRNMEERINSDNKR